MCIPSNLKLHCSRQEYQVCKLKKVFMGPNIQSPRAWCTNIDHQISTLGL